MTDRPPFDETTLVDADELAEWLRLDADEVSAFARAGIFPRNPEGRFPLVKAIRGYIRVQEANERRSGPVGGKGDNGRLLTSLTSLTGEHGG